MPFSDIYGGKSMTGFSPETGKDEINSIDGTITRSVMCGGVALRAYCTSSGCVGSAIERGRILIGDTKQIDRPPFRFTREEWLTFLTGQQNDPEARRFLGKDVQVLDDFVNGLGVQDTQEAGTI